MTKIILKFKREITIFFMLKKLSIKWWKRSCSIWNGSDMIIYQGRNNFGYTVKECSHEYDMSLNILKWENKPVSNLN